MCRYGRRSWSVMATPVRVMLKAWFDHGGPKGGQRRTVTAIALMRAPSNSTDKTWSVVEDQSWMDSAACKGHTELFFSPHVHGPQCNSECIDGRREKGRNDRVNKARALCRPCPVRVECLTFAMITMQTDGLWGGLTERERQDMRSVQRAIRRTA